MSFTCLDAQVTIYSEDFSGALINNKGQNGATYDMTGVSQWSINVANGMPFSAGDYFYVNAGQFHVEDADGINETNPCWWLSPSIDISCYNNVSVSADLIVNTSGISSNYVRMYYSIDGGAFIPVGAAIAGNGTNTTRSASGLSGSTIQIKIAYWGTSSTGSMRHDNVLVVGTVSYPSLPPSNPSLSNYTGTNIDLSWTNGNGDRVLVLAVENGTSIIDPVKGTSYSANTTFGAGSTTGAGNYVVYEGTGTSATIGGLNPGVDYDFAVYSYNSICPWYNPNEAFASTKCTPPLSQCYSASTSAATANSLIVSWLSGSGDATLVVAKTASAALTDPSSGTNYTANSTFGSGTQIGTSNYVVYNGSGTSVNVSGLASSTTYDFAIYSYNSADLCYNVSEASVSGTTLSLASPFEMDAINGSIINTCSGTFTDAGGAGGAYGNNENYIATFCSGNGAPLKFDFSGTGFDIDMAGDSLIFYDGTTASGTPIAILTYLDDRDQTTYSSTLQINTLSTCVTVRWKSNSSGTDAGWAASISCGIAPSCASNTAAADIFGQATPICNIDNYCGTTASYYGEDTPFNLIGGGTCPVPDDALFGGTIENNSWLKFEALSTNATFNFNVSGGASCLSGIQVGVFAFNPSTSLFTLKSPCALTDGGQLGAFSLTASALTIGETYYLMIDGNSGDQCDYTIGVNTGVVIINAGNDQAICTSSTNLSATSTINGGSWSVVAGSGTFANPTSPISTVSGLAMGTNVFRWTSNTDLCGSQSDDVTITRTTCLPIELITLDAHYINDKNVALHWITASETNNDFFSLQRSEDGIVFQTIAIVDGKGTYNQISEYQHLDKVPYYTTFYYRLMQTDFDGTTSISEPVVADPSAASFNGHLSIAQNESDNLQIIFWSNETSNYTLNIFSAGGQLLFSSEVNAGSGLNKWSIPELFSHKGAFVAILQNEKNIFDCKFLKVE